MKKKHVEKMKELKKVVMLCICCVCIFTLNISAYGANEKQVLVDENELEKLIIQTTNDWTEIVEPDLDLKVGDIVEIVDANSEDVQYSVSLFSKMIPYGYVVVGVENGDVVVLESNITYGNEGLYTEIVDEIVDDVKDRKKVDIKKQIVKVAPLQYGLNYIDEKGVDKTVDNYGNELEVSSEVKAYASEEYSGVRAIYITEENFDKKSKYVIDDDNSVYLMKFENKSKLVTSQYVKENTKLYACGVQALLQIGYMEGLHTYSQATLKDTYLKLWNFTGTWETWESRQKYSKDKVFCGEGFISWTAKGFVKYAKSKGYKGTEYKGIENEPSTAWIKNKLEYNRPVLMSYGINVNGDWSGHMISVLGVVRAKKVSSGNSWNYLMVYNGWDDTVQYINYSCVDFIDCKATYFWVKK